LTKIRANNAAGQSEKKEFLLRAVNHAMLRLLNPEQVKVEICRADKLAERRWLSLEFIILHYTLSQEDLEEEWVKTHSISRSGFA